MNNKVPEDVYVGDLMSFPGPWDFQLPRSAIILVNDNELIEMANGRKVACKRDHNTLIIEITERSTSRWLFGVNVI